jgi:hypothetical protein
VGGWAALALLVGGAIICLAEGLGIFDPDLLPYDLDGYQYDSWGAQALAEGLGIFGPPPPGYGSWQEVGGKFRGY